MEEYIYVVSRLMVSVKGPDLVVQFKKKKDSFPKEERSLMRETDKELKQGLSCNLQWIVYKLLK